MCHKVKEKAYLKSKLKISPLFLFFFLHFQPTQASWYFPFLIFSFHCPTPLIALTQLLKKRKERGDKQTKKSGKAINAHWFAAGWFFPQNSPHYQVSRALSHIPCQFTSMHRPQRPEHFSNAAKLYCWQNSVSKSNNAKFQTENPFSLQLI